MGNVEKRKKRSSAIFQDSIEAIEAFEPSTSSVSQLPSEYLGVPLVDHDSTENETFVVIAKRFGKQIVYRFSKQKSLYLFSPRSSLRRCVIFITTNQYFEIFILLLIITNCILLAFKDQPENVEYMFAALYTLEMILKIIGKGFFFHKFAYLRDPWNWLDFVVVILGYLTMAPSVANLSGIRTFRVLRALRTISVIEGLRAMVNAFLRSMRMLTDVLALSSFFISIFALIGMQLFVGVLRNKCVLTPGVNVTDFDTFLANESNWLYVNDDPVVCGNSSTARACPSNYTCFSDVGDNPNHGYTSFDTFPWALLCTIQLVTADYWENVYEYIIASNGFWSVFYFLIVIFFGSFYILNLILAVVALSYQQEVANIKNKETDNQLQKTSSSYSLHTSFKPQKLFPSKPSKTTSNWPSVLRRYTQTSPYVGNPVASSGPYHPSTPDDKTLPAQSPLTLDKVTPYAFDDESVVSFYNYEAETIDTIQSEPCLKSSVEVGKRNKVTKAEDGNMTANYEMEMFQSPRETIEFNKLDKYNKTTGLRSSEKKDFEENSKDFETRQNTLLRDSTEELFKSLSCRVETNVDGNYKDESFASVDISKVTEKQAVTTAGAATNSQRVSNELHSAAMLGKDTVSDSHASDDELLETNIKATETNRQYSVQHGSKVAKQNNSVPSVLVSNSVSSDTTSTLVLRRQENVAQKINESIGEQHCDTDCPKNTFKPTASKNAQRKSVEMALSSAQSIGLMIVTSSVCVMIPQATGLHHSPVHKVRRKCAKLIMSPMFDWFITGVIFLNTVVMAAEHHGMSETMENNLNAVNLACTFVFLIEMIVKVTALSARGYIQSRWNILDGIIVVISAIETIIVWCVPSITHGLGFSVLRTFRLIRILKLAQSWVTMRALLSTIGASIGQLGNLTLLLAIVTYTFAVIGMQLFSESFTAKHFEDKVVPRWNFTDFMHSFMIIFRVLCGEWIEPLVMTMHMTTPRAVVFYFAVLIIGNFLILNLFLALLLNSFSTESLTNTQSKQPVNIKEKFGLVVKRYLGVMRAFRAFRVSGKTKTDGERTNGDSSHIDPSRSWETHVKELGVENNVSDVIHASLSKLSEDAFRHHDDVIPSCFPNFCCQNLKEKKDRRSMAYNALIVCRAKVLGIVEHRYFDPFIMLVIFISSISLALEDVYLDSKPDLKSFLRILNYVVTVVFVVEFLLKLFGFGFLCYFRNPWNCLDFFIVVVSIVSLIGSVNNGNLTAFRSLRTLRALRPLRAIPRWQGMKVVVNSLLSAIPEIGNVSLVCLIFWLIFSVMGVHFFGGRFYKCLDDQGEIFPHTIVENKTSCIAMNYTWKNSDVNFDNALAGFLALFQVATFEGWIEIMADAADVTKVDKQPERDKNHMSHLYFVVFVLFGSFFVLNLFVGVIIDNFNRLKKEYESGAVGLFLTETQKAWYDTLKKAASKKPRKVAKKPKEKWRVVLYDIVNSSKFEVAIMMLIVLNMMIMMVRHHGQSDTITNILLFTIIFCLEALLRLCVQRLDYFKEPWNVFDFIVVLLSIAGLVMEYLNHAFIVTPSIFRVVRVFRVGRLLRFYKNARGVRRLLFALLISLPALVNIGALLFLLLFIYAIIGMSSFAYVKHSGAINDMVNFETFRNSMLLLFRLSTSAGWNDVLAPLMVQPPDCDPTHDDLPNGNCGSPYFAIFYFVSFVLITSLIIINMYIAVIMENLHEAFKAEAAGITHDDLDMFYHKWEEYDPHATQHISHSLLSDFVDSLEEPMRLPKPNKFACINLHIPIQKGDRIHCVDVLQALVRRLLGDIEQENPEAFTVMQKKLEEAFLAAFPNRAKQRTETTTFVRNREICAALIIQKAWRKKILKSRTSRQVVSKPSN